MEVAAAKVGHDGDMGRPLALAGAAATSAFVSCSASLSGPLILVQSVQNDAEVGNG